jgi:hypothetical protein
LYLAHLRDAGLIQFTEVDNRIADLTVIADLQPK